MAQLLGIITAALLVTAGIKGYEWLRKGLDG